MFSCGSGGREPGKRSSGMFCLPLGGGDGVFDRDGRRFLGDGIFRVRSMLHAALQSVSSCR